jgi:hypothetical protein
VAKLKKRNCRMVGVIRPVCWNSVGFLYVI